jgi:peptidoglycan/LPS O-acetylase OafA/YrhL
MNAAYLQDIFVYRSPIGTVAWTLCLEVQFYLALIILTGISAWLAGIFAPRDPRGIASAVTWWLLLGSLGVASAIMWYSGYNGLNFFGTWHRFFLGVLIFRCLSARASPLPLYVLLLTLTVLSVGFDDPRGFTAALTAGLILFVGKRGKLDRWLRGRIWQFLGRISYSLYLYHVVLAIPFLRLAWSYMPNNLSFAVILVIFGILVSIVFGWIIHQLIERPSVALSRKVSYTKRHESVDGFNRKLE